MNNTLDFVQKKSILVVDDTPDNLSLMAGLLKDSYRVKLANNGEKALAAVRGPSPPDLILLDIMMPRLSGYEVCHRLKGSEATRAIPILMVTALAEMSDIEKGIDAGADDFLTKPINKLELITRVRSLLRVRHLTNDYERLLAHVLNVESQREQPGNR